MIKTNSPLVCPLCFFVIFAVLGFLCYHCSSLHMTESRLPTRVSTVFNSKAVCVQKIHPIGNLFAHRYLKLYVPCTRTNTSSSKILARYAGNEHFPPPIPRSLLSATPCDFVIRHGRGRGLGPGSNLALPRVVKPINVHYFIPPSLT